MSDYDRGYPRSAPVGTADAAVDTGLRAFMLGVYNKMAVGLLLAAGIAWTVGNVPAVSHLFFRYLGSQPSGYTGLGLIVAIAPLAIILFSNFFMRNMTAATSATLYWTLVALIGASLGVLFLVYTGPLIITAFLVTAIAFGGLSLVGYMTKRDLSPMGSFLIMGVWGIVATSFLGVFFHNLFANTAFFYIFNAVALAIFAGIVAWRTQQLKETYYQVRGDGESMAVATNLGALSLFIAFVNMFQTILALMGGNRR